MGVMALFLSTSGEGWVDTKDPNIIAETELLQAAASIEAAAKKLSELRPRRTAVRHTHTQTERLVRLVLKGAWEKGWDGYTPKKLSFQF